MRLPAALALLLWGAPALAQGLSGYAEAKGVAFSERASEGDPWVAGWATLLLKEEQRLDPASLAASLRVEALSSDEDAARFDPADRDPRRSLLSVRELWGRFALAQALDLQLGRFELGWGKTDGYSPADAFLPRDLTDPFADEKLPLWAARLSGQRGPVRFEAVAVPVTTPWRLPDLGSRNAPVPVSSAAGRIEYEDQEDAPPVPGFGALRLLAVVGDWDLGAWGRFGVRPAPLLTFRADLSQPGSSGVTVPVERRYAREEGVGLELSRVVGPWVVRAEAAGLFSRDPDLGNALIGTLGAERGFGDGTLLVTLAGNVVDPPGDAALLFDRALLPALIAAWNRAEAWGSWKVVWTAALAHRDGLVKAEAGYDLADAWKLTLGGELPYGSERGPLGALHAARRVHLALRYSW
ncbi:MAG: hypothetical protein HZB55_00215 [Deltaproteobacteria bacterium]|nr:hypothetical protein [Deltaproteobacteria bacterium]